MKIYTNIPQHFDDFIRLNEMWIKTYFSIEENDRALARNPRQVIDNGGYIFTGVVDNKVVATSALFVKNNEYELARMAVDPQFQGHGYGRSMGLEVIDVARELGVDQLRLYTHDSLVPAVKLYESLGFQPVHCGPHPEYRRCNLVMSMAITKPEVCL